MSATLSIESPELHCEIALRGAELLSLHTPSGAELLWQRDPQWWDRSSPVLFPIIGRPHDGEVVYHGRRYPMPQHGIAHDAEFTLVERWEDRCVLELRDDPLSRTHFPFPFVLSIGYAVRGSRLYAQAKLRNPGDAPMPAAFGFHPGFACDPGAGSFWLDFGADDPGQFQRNGVFTPTTALPVATRRFILADRDFRDGALLMSPYRGGAIMLGAMAVPRLRVRTYHLETMAIWRKPGAPFICIEPWSGVPVSMSVPGEDLGDSDLVAKLPGKAERYWGMVIETVV